MGISARALDQHGVPQFPCGCGKRGCIETYISGTGLANIAEFKTGTRAPAEHITAPDVLGIWADIAGETLATIQNTLDPHCIVIGGGLSKMAGITDRLTEALTAHRLGQALLPDITLARHGDSSGARGAALMAAGMV